LIIRFSDEPQEAQVEASSLECQAQKSFVTSIGILNLAQASWPSRVFPLEAQEEHL
jgi:hypothetical protein